MNWHYFHARMFDSQLGRWHCKDPLTIFASPYIGMGNNPVSMIDPDGRGPVWDWIKKLFRRGGNKGYNDDIVNPDNNGSGNFWQGLANYFVGGTGSGQYGSMSGYNSGSYGLEGQSEGGLNNSNTGRGGAGGGSGSGRRGRRSTEFPDYLFEHESGVGLSKAPDIEDIIKGLTSEIAQGGLMEGQLLLAQN